MEKIKHGLISYDGIAIEIEKEKLKEISENICNKYINESEDNKNKFLEYDKNFPFSFSKFYFLIDELGYKYVGSLLTESLDYEINNDMNNLRLSNLTISKYINDENAFMNLDGIFIYSKKVNVLHSCIAEQIVFYIMLNNIAVYNDYKKIDKERSIYSKDMICDYLVNRLGFAKIGNYYRRYIMYNESLITPSQKEQKDFLVECGYTDSQVVNEYDNRSEVKKLIKLYRG